MIWTKTEYTTIINPAKQRSSTAAPGRRGGRRVPGAGHGYLSKKDFLVEIFSWPTPGNIDLTECRRLSVNHVALTGEIFSFWEAQFYNDRLRLKGQSPLQTHP